MTGARECQPEADGPYTMNVRNLRRRAQAVFLACDAGPAEDISAAMKWAADRIEHMTKALEDIRDHWANQYDHPRKENEMYRGPYGIGVTDGHRACTIIAERGLAMSLERSGGAT